MCLLHCKDTGRGFVLQARGVSIIYRGGMAAGRLSRGVGASPRRRLPRALGDLLWPLLCLGLAGLASARHPQQIHPGVAGVCRAIISKVQSYTESNLQSSLVGMRGGICTWLELNGCQQYKVVFTPVYKIAFRTVYVNGFVCCSGYSRVGNSCVPNQDTTAVPPLPAPSRLPGITQPVTGPQQPAADSDQAGSSLPGHTGPRPAGTARPAAPPRGPSTGSPPTSGGVPDPERTPRGEEDPPAARDRLLIILLILVILVALFAVASFACHLAKLWHRGRMACCFGLFSLPRFRTGRNAPEDTQKISGCILSTISSDCSTESVGSDMCAVSHRSGSDQSGCSGGSELTVINDDSDSGIVKHVVYERCWKDTTSLLPYASSSSSSSSLSSLRGSSLKVTGRTSKRCTPLLTIPLTPLSKKRRPSPPLPVRPEPIYDTTPRSPPSPVPAPHISRSSPTPRLPSPPTPRLPSPGPYSYTSLTKRDRQNSSPSPAGGEAAAVAASSQITAAEDQTEVDHRYVNVKSALGKKPRPVYVTLDPSAATESVHLGTECCEGDNDPWRAPHSPEAPSIASVGYCALSNQVFPHRVSGNGYDKLKRCGQNLPLAQESFQRPEYDIPSVTTSTSCLAVEPETEDRDCRASPDVRQNRTLPGVTVESLKISGNMSAEEAEKEERYIRAPRHNHKELVFIDTVRRVKISATTVRHNSVG